MVVAADEGIGGDLGVFQHPRARRDVVRVDIGERLENPQHHHQLADAAWIAPGIRVMLGVNGVVRVAEIEHADAVVLRLGPEQGDDPAREPGIGWRNAEVRVPLQAQTDLVGAEQGARLQPVARKLALVRETEAFQPPDTRLRVAVDGIRRRLTRAKCQQRRRQQPVNEQHCTHHDPLLHSHRFTIHRD